MDVRLKNIYNLFYKNITKISSIIWSVTGRVGRGSSGGARKSRVVSFDSAQQAKLMGKGA